MILKKGISPVVATALLIVVSVIAVVGFQQWYSSFESGLLTNTEKKSSSNIANINIESISDDGIVYIKNTNEEILISTIRIGDSLCISNQTLNPNINNISIKHCLDVNDDIAEVILIFDEGIVEEKIFVEDLVNTFSSCTLDSITRVHGENYVFYNNSVVPFGSSCFSLNKVCSDGIYLGDTTYNYSSCSVLGQDVNPLSFAFNNQTDVSTNSLITSNILVPTGYDGPLSVGITGDGSPQISVDGGPWITSGNMNLSQSLQIRLTSSSSGLTNFVANLTLGNYSTLWGVKTISSSLTCVTDVDGDNYFNSGCASYPMSYLTFEDFFDVDDNYDSTGVDFSCVFNSIKSSCNNNFLVDGCGSGTVLDEGTGFCWQRDFGASGNLQWSAAKTYCNNLVLGGHSDWVMPTRQELMSIVDLSRITPAVVGGVTKFQNVGDRYWTVSSYGPNTANAWVMRMGYGKSAGEAKTFTRAVGCVRR